MPKIIIDLSEEQYKGLKSIPYGSIASKIIYDKIKQGAVIVVGEYIKKSELFDKTVRRNSIWNEVSNSEGKGLEEIVNDLPTYSFPDSADPMEQLEREYLIESVKEDIKTTCSENVRLTNAIEKIRAEIEDYRNILIPPKTSLKNLLEVQSALNKVLEIIDKYIGGK